MSRVCFQRDREQRDRGAREQRERAAREQSERALYGEAAESSRAAEDCAAEDIKEGPVLPSQRTIAELPRNLGNIVIQNLVTIGATKNMPEVMSQTCSSQT